MARFEDDDCPATNVSAYMVWLVKKDLTQKSEADRQREIEDEERRRGAVPAANPKMDEIVKTAREDAKKHLGDLNHPNHPKR